MLAYVDDIMVMGETKEKVINATWTLTNATKKNGTTRNRKRVHIHIKKTVKYRRYMSRQLYVERINEYKYLDVNINSKNFMRIEINERITNGNKFYFNILLRSKLLSIK